MCRIGRKPPLVIAVAMQVVAGTAAAFVPWYWLFLLLRFTSAVATGGTMISSFVLVMELVKPSYRTPIGLLYQVPFTVGHLGLVGISYFLRDWRFIQLTISLSAILLLSYQFILPESPKWLLAVGKTEQSVVLMEKIAK